MQVQSSSSGEEAKWILAVAGSLVTHSLAVAKHVDRAKPRANSRPSLGVGRLLVGAPDRHRQRPVGARGGGCLLLGDCDIIGLPPRRERQGGGCTTGALRHSSALVQAERSERTAANKLEEPREEAIARNCHRFQSPFK